MSTDVVRPVEVMMTRLESRCSTAPLELVDHHRPHCVPFDIMMPGTCGDELCERLRAQYGDDIVLIAVGGYSETDPRVGRAFALADHCFTKPVDTANLLELLRPHH